MFNGIAVSPGDTSDDGASEPFANSLVDGVVVHCYTRLSPEEGIGDAVS